MGGARSEIIVNKRDITTLLLFYPLLHDLHKKMDTLLLTVYVTGTHKHTYVHTFFFLFRYYLGC